MKYTLIISLFVLPLVSMGQKNDTIALRLHIATDSLAFYRCRVNCARVSGNQDSLRIYELHRRVWQEEVHTYYLKYDTNYLDPKKQKKNFRFQNPNKYFKCPCQ